MRTPPPSSRASGGPDGSGRAPARVSLYWGDDTWSMENAARDLAARLGGEIPLETWRTMGSDASAGAIAERVGTSPLFGGGTLVVVSDPAPLLRSAAGREALRAAMDAVAPGNGLVFLDSVGGSGRRPVAHDHLRSDVAGIGGEVREFKAPREGQLAAWIETRARERSVHLGRGAAQALAERVGGFVREGDVDRRRQGQMAVAELDKLALYRPGAEVSADDVRALVAEAVPGSTWAFLDAIAMRRAAAATELLGRLLASTPEPVILVQLHRRLRELLEVGERLADGTLPAKVVSAMKLNPYRAEILAGQARRWTGDELAAALDGLLELDVAAKGAEGRMATDSQRLLAWTLWIADRVRPS